MDVPRDDGAPGRVRLSRSAHHALPSPGGDGRLLNGSKCFIGNAHRSPLGVVTARTGPGPLGIRCLIVDASHPGCSAGPIATLGMRGALGTLDFQDVPVPEEHLLGRHLSPTRRGMWGWLHSFNPLRCVAAAMGVGLARAAHAYALEHAPHHHSALRHSLDALGTRIRGVQSLTRFAAHAVDADPTNAHLPSAAKTAAARLAVEATSTVLRLLGPGGPDRTPAARQVGARRLRHRMHGGHLAHPGHGRLQRPDPHRHHASPRQLTRTGPRKEDTVVEPDPHMDEVHLWHIRLDGLSPAAASRYEAALGPDERARRTTYPHARGRARFTAAHGALRILLGHFLGIPAVEVRTRRGPMGKPALPSGSPPVHFSLSHAGGRAVAAVSLGREVGVDLDHPRAASRWRPSPAATSPGGIRPGPQRPARRPPARLPAAVDAQGSPGQSRGSTHGAGRRPAGRRLGGLSRRTGRPPADARHLAHPGRAPADGCRRRRLGPRPAVPRRHPWRDHRHAVSPPA
ncbi:hypothetical protein GCM10020000_77040 [Streptomyces olivoverticillatus]